MTLRPALAPALALAALAAGPAGAGAAAPRVALTAVPAHVQLAGAGATAIRVVNSGTAPVVVDASMAGFTLDLHGRPRVVARSAGARAGAGWIRLGPRAFALPAGAATLVRLVVRPPRHAAPGDHPALVLLTTRPQPRAGVAVRMQIGVTVNVRIAGRIVHRLEPRSLRVRTTRSGRVLELEVVNRGNVVESPGRGRITVTLAGAGGRAVRLPASPRRILPRTHALIELPLRVAVRLPVKARVSVACCGGSTLRRSFTIRPRSP